MADIDLSDFEEKPAARAKIPLAAVRAASEKQNFPSRAANPLPPPARGRRTGRSHQLNIKVTAEMARHFGALADAKGWSLAEAFEVAVAALEEKYLAKG